MFSESIFNNPFLGEIADPIFTDIEVSVTGFGDYTFLSTARALLSPRMREEDNPINIRVVSPLRIDLGLLKGDNPMSYIRERVNTDGWSHRNTLVVIPIEVTAGRSPDMNIKEARSEAIDRFAQSFKETSDWTNLDRVSLFFQRYYKVGAFHSPSRGMTIALVGEAITLPVFHHLQAATLSYFPQLFKTTEQQMVTEDERDLIMGLTDSNPSRYKAALYRLSLRYNFREEFIKRNLESFEMSFEKLEAEKVAMDIERTRGDIKDTKDRLSIMLSNMRELNFRKLGILNSIASHTGDSEIMKYFLANKSLSLRAKDKTSISFGVVGYLEYFDEDILEAMLSQKNSLIYETENRSYEEIVPKEDMELLMRALFIDRDLRVRTSGEFEINLRDLEVIPKVLYDIHSDSAQTFPNIHLYAYSCLGNNEPLIIEALESGNYIGAVEQCVASVRNLNFSDVPAFKKFMEVLYTGRVSGSYGTKNIPLEYIETPDGEILDVKGAIAWLKAQNPPEEEETLVNVIEEEVEAEENVAESEENVETNEENIEINEETPVEDEEEVDDEQED